MQIKTAPSILSVLFAATSVDATLLFEDTYSTIPSGPNYAFVNDGTPSMSSGTNLTYTGLESTGSSLDIGIFQTNSNDADTTLRNDADFTDTASLVGTNPTVYFSVAMQVPDVSVFGNNGGSAYAGFGMTGSNTADYGLGLNVSGAGDISFVVDRGTGTVDLGGSVAEGETVLVIGRISGWQSFGVPTTFEYTLNPDLSLDESSQTWASVTAVGNISPNAVASTSYLRVNAFSNAWNDDNNSAFLVDEHRVGTTWSDVTPAAIPEPSTCILVSGALLFSVATIRRRR